MGANGFVGYPLGRHVSRQQKIQYGIGAVRETLVQHLDGLGGRRALVVAGNTLSRTSEVMDPLVGALGNHFLETVVPPKSHGEVAGVVELAARMRDRAPDCVVSFGGGGVMDFAKALAVALGLNLRSAEAFDAYFGDRRPENEAGASDAQAAPLHHVAIPTTLAGAQHSAASGFVDPKTHAKRIYFHAQLLPDWVILDPEVTVSTPPALWAASGIKALDHVVEKYYAVPPHPVIDALAITAAPVIFSGLSRSVDPAAKDALQYRLDLLIGAWQAMFGSVGFFKSGLSHAIGRHLGAICGVQHGLTSCLTLPAVIEFNLPNATPRIADLGVRFGLGGDDAAAVPGAVRELIVSLGLPTRLRDADVSRGDLAAVARRSMDDPAIRTNPRPVSDAGEIEALLESIW